MSDILKYGNAIRLAQLAADPSGPENGTLYYNTVSNVYREYINGGWADAPTGAEVDAVIADVADLVTLSGVAANEPDLGTFTGVTIPDDSTIKTALQSLETAHEEVDQNVNDLITLSGVAENATTLGTFTGTTIPDSSTIKAALQSLETSVETKAASSVVAEIDQNVDDLITLSGVAENATSLGTFTGTIIPDSSTVKAALQSLETFAEAIPDAFFYAGVYNATTDSPALDNTDTGKEGYLYYVTVAGSQDFGAGSISFEVGDKVVNNGTTWDKWDMTDAVTSVNGQTGIVVLTTSNISEGSNLYFTDERAQDAVGTILVDTASVDLVYTDGTPSITATVLPAGVDHNSLLNFVANKHIDHSAVQIATASATSGLAGGGDITTTRNLVVDINGTTAETVADNADKVLIYDNSATALKSMTRANFLSGIAVASAGDINESSYTGLADNTADQVVTGLAFNNAVVRSFRAHVSVSIDATADLFAIYELQGVQKGASWDMSQLYTGDSIPSFSFNITSVGQVRATIGTVAGFVSAVIKFRAQTTTV